MSLRLVRDRAPLTPRRDAVAPRRDGVARAALAQVGERARPVVLARDRLLPVGGALGALLPDGGLRRGSVVAVEGGPGSGATSLGLRLAAAATATGAWAAVADPDGTFGGLAAAEAGVVLERLAVVRGVSGARWSAVVAALIDGVALVVGDVPVGLRATDAHRLVARVRERGAVLVAVGGLGRAWPEAALRIRAEGREWPGGTVRVVVEGRGAADRRRSGVLAVAG